MKKEEFKQLLVEVLRDYHHYKFMSSGILGIFKGWGHGMNMSDFMLWLKSQR